MSRTMMNRTSGESEEQLDVTASRFPATKLMFTTPNYAGISAFLAPAAQVCRKKPPRKSAPDPDGLPIVEIRRSGPEIAADAALNTLNTPNTAPPLTDDMADENAKMTDCYYEKKDWRACKDEVCGFLVIQDWMAADETGCDCAGQMEKFRECWKAQGNDRRTDTKHA